jgi:hypothetical protein
MYYFIRLRRASWLINCILFYVLIIAMDICIVISIIYAYLFSILLSFVVGCGIRAHVPYLYIPSKLNCN